MKINFDQQITTIDGTPIKYGEDEKPLTLKIVCVEALMVHAGNCPTCNAAVEPVSNQEAIMLWDLATKIYKCKGPCELSAEEIVLIQNRLSKRWAHIAIISQAHRMLNNE